mmetsp:Transcript_136686/g.237714  ORF Transcript_136686/g.237714 Transcript_136686/m.237714 type:complete len:233 (-) Transcript_136686:57-755(-)
MAAANKINNFQLLEMLKQAEKTQSDRIQQRMQQRAADLCSGVASADAPGTRIQAVEPSAPCGRMQQEQKAEETCADDFHMDVVPLTHDEIEWLEEVAKKNGHASTSGVVRQLIDWANAEPPEAKKKLFLVIRCRRCSAGAKGGVKKDIDMELSDKQWQWLNNVKDRCRHASVGKTIRIIVDFYMPLCKDDPDFEQKILQAGRLGKSARHADAAGAVGKPRDTLKPCECAHGA